jgi:Flp pilus assembly pilin Flp
MRKVIRRLKDERGVVSVEWIILSILIMVAITVAFVPYLRTALSNGVTAVSSALTNQANAGGS